MMIKAIIFDFDGVIIESAHIKTEAFRELFSKWPAIADKAIEYHLKNTGVSRFYKFRYVYEELLKQPYSDNIGQALSNEFARICFEKVKIAPLVKGVVEFLEKDLKKYRFVIASSSPDNELQEIIGVKNLQKYFADVYGHPQSKEKSVQMTLKKYQLNNKEIVFIGDGESDLKAAGSNGVHFILRRTVENQSLEHLCKMKMNDFNELENFLENIECQKCV